MADPIEELQTIVGALIAQLHQQGTLDRKGIGEIAKRLDWAEMPDAADMVRSIPILDDQCQPGELRGGFEVIIGGLDDD